MERWYSGALAARLGRVEDIACCLDMVTTFAAKLMNLPDYGIAVGVLQISWYWIVAMRLRPCLSYRSHSLG
jgi:hypothetical protein